MKKYLFILILLSLHLTVLKAGFFGVENLRCEYVVNPLGVDIPKPHLSWIMKSDTRGSYQTAYQIIVASSIDLLNKNKGDVWDSGKVLSSESNHIVYQGENLVAAKKYFWKVRTWNKDGKSSKWSDSAFWTMGLLSAEDWKGSKWIAFKNNDVWKEEWKKHKEKELNNNDPKGWPWLTGMDSTIFALYETANPKYDPSPLFRKNLPIKKNVKSAFLYICGLGYYEAFINGKRVGDHVLDPAWTNYEQRAMYSTYDVTDMLQQGTNTIGVMLGRGQYNPLCNDVWNLYKSAWVDQPKLIALINIEFSDGSKSNIITDDTWKTSGGPVVYDDTRYGELYDARLEQQGWDTPVFNDQEWRDAVEVVNNTTLVSQMMPPIRCFEEVKPVKTIVRSDNETVYDLGEYISGWADVELSGPEGANVLIDYCETPSDNELLPNLTPSRFDYDIKDKYYASFYDNGVKVRQQNGYILKGKDRETARCRFSYKSFRFIRIICSPEVTLHNVSGIPVHTDVETVGRFECSNPVINKIQQNAINSLKCNYQSISTDCPHREKQGWTADIYMSAQAAMYNFNMAAFYTKWLTDLNGTKDERGGLCTVAPSTKYDMAISTAWPAAIVYLPMDLYWFYADKRPMKDNYDAMKNFVQNSLLREVQGKPNIINDVLGDWCAPLMEIIDNRRNNTMPPPEGHLLYGTSSHFLTVKRLSEIGKLLGNTNDADYHKNWADKISTAYNNEFFDAPSSVYHGNIPTEYRQSPNVVSLAYGLVSKEKEKSVSKNLIADIHSKGNRLSTGFLGTMALMEYLPLVDSELAYTVVSQKEYPGWGYMIEQGAGSMWEDWDGYASRNHTPLCLVSAYFYKYLAGIQFDTDNPGFKHIVINPSVVGDLEYVNAHHDSQYGRIESGWKREKGKFTLNISIPANTTATVFIPANETDVITESGKMNGKMDHVTFEGWSDGRAVYKTGSGNYSFTVAGENKK